MYKQCKYLDEVATHKFQEWDEKVHLTDKPIQVEVKNQYNSDCHLDRNYFILS